MKHFMYVCLALVACFLFSCDSITEEIHLEKSGGGEYDVYVNISPQMIGLLGGLIEEETGEDLDIPIDSIMQTMPETWDTLVPMGDEYREKLKGLPAYQAVAEKSNIFASISKEDDALKIGYHTSFSNMDELNTFQDLLQKIGNEEGDPEMMNPLSGSGIQSQFDSKKRHFSRTAKVESGDFDMDDMGDEDNQELLESMMPDYRTIIHLPRRLKSVTKGGEYRIKEGEDDKTVIFEYDMIELMKGEANMDFDIKMKRR